MKRSDPAVYKTFLVLFITFLNVVTSVLRKVKRKVRVAVGGDWTRSELQASVSGGGAVRDAGRGFLYRHVLTHNSGGCGAESRTT